MIDVAIIGAGPYGLSLAAYLRANGVEHRIFGKPMEPWKTGMPPGMQLKSHPWSSSLYDPTSSFTVKQFCAEQAIPYHDSLLSLPLETFAAYGEAFQKRFAPGVEPKMLTALRQADNGFIATFDDGDVVAAHRVVLAIGVHPFMYVPADLTRLPKELWSHSGEHGPIDGLADKTVAILGGGSSATDLAALLLAQGASVSLVARSGALKFASPQQPTSSLTRYVKGRLRPLANPTSGLGSGWPLKFYAEWPGVFHGLPASLRMRIVRTTLGPLGHASVKEQVLGAARLCVGRTLESARSSGGKVDLQLLSRDGDSTVLQADHVVAATGYRIDLRRIGFLGPELLSRIQSVENSPVLSRAYESSVPGLHFAGPATADSFGPVARFVFGAIHPARSLARHLSRRPVPGRSAYVRGASRSEVLVGG